jgi:hypothetical protein
MKVNYDELTVICDGSPSEESLKNFYNLLIDYLIRDYGKDAVGRALKEFIEKQ